MSLISRENLIHYFESCGEKRGNILAGDILIQDVVDVIEDAPTADAEPVVHAHWIDTGNSFEDGQCRYNYWECSHCHRQIAGRYGLPDYCPNCGARMDLGDVKHETD